MMGGIMLVSAGFSEIFAAWESVGVFTYLLPFLLIFALVFGILTRIKIFKENRWINAIIALAVSLMTLQFPLVSEFFSEIIPRLSIALIIILAILILTGLFADPDSNVVNYVLLGIGVVVVIVVLIQTAKNVGWSYGEWWANNWTMLLGVIIILIFVIIIVASSAPKGKEPKAYKGMIFKE